MTALEVLEREANRRGVTRFVLTCSLSEEPARRYRVFPVSGAGFSIQWYFGATPEDAIEKMVSHLPIPVAPESGEYMRESDPFPESHPYRRSA